MKNKINIEITQDGWTTDILFNCKSIGNATNVYRLVLNVLKVILNRKKNCLMIS